MLRSDQTWFINYNNSLSASNSLCFRYKEMAEGCIRILLNFYFIILLFVYFQDCYLKIRNSSINLCGFIRLICTKIFMLYTFLIKKYLFVPMNPKSISPSWKQSWGRQELGATHANYHLQIKQSVFQLRNYTKWDHRTTKSAHTKSYSIIDP